MSQVMSVALFSELLQTSRPRFWGYLLGPIIVAVFAGLHLQGYGVETWWQLIFLGVFFTWPANFFLYAVNDIADTQTDHHNPKKGQQELLFSENRKKVVGLLAAVIGIVFLGVSWWLPPLSKIFTWGWLLLAAAYSLPPVRFKSRPVLDAYSNVLYVLPGFAVYSLLSGVVPSWWVFLGCWCWTAGLHTYSALPDISADSQAGVTTTAVSLGLVSGMWFVAINWLAAAVVFSVFLGTVGLLSLVYPMFILGLLFSTADPFKLHQKIEQIYWWVPVVTMGVGFAVVVWVYFHRVSVGTIPELI